MLMAFLRIYSAKTYLKLKKRIEKSIQNTSPLDIAITQKSIQNIIVTRDSYKLKSMPDQIYNLLSKLKMGYNSNCYVQTCKYNCCSITGYCPSVSTGCYFYYTTSSSTSSTSSISYYGLDSGIIAGITVGCVAAVVILIVLICHCYKKSKLQQAQMHNPPNNTTVILSQGNPKYGQPLPGETLYTQPSFGQPSFGQPSFGQAYIEPPNAHFDINQVPLGQLPIGQQAPLGQPSYGQVYPGNQYPPPNQGPVYF